MTLFDQQLESRLLRIARETLNATLQGESIAFANVDDLRSIPHNGLFVTLRRQGELRGCIGTFADRRDLVDVIAAIAQATLGDPRFADRRISANELVDIRIELSILSPLESMTDPLDFERGVHGIHLRHSNATGCFLPEVGMDVGWDKETFLSQLCHGKAGVDRQAWRSNDVVLSRFTVTKIVEG